MGTIFGCEFQREFFGGPEALEKQGQIIRGTKSLEKSAEKFDDNFPKIRRTKDENSRQIRSAEPRDQHLALKKHSLRYHRKHSAAAVWLHVSRDALSIVSGYFLSFTLQGKNNLARQKQP